MLVVSSFALAEFAVENRFWLAYTLARLSTSMQLRTHAGQPPIAILGVPFDQLSATELTDLLERMILSRRPHHLVTADMGFLLRAQADVELRRVLFEANLVLCEGAPLLRAARWLGQPQADCVAGAELLPLLLRAAAEKQWKVCLAANDQEAAERAVTKFKATHPRLQLSAISLGMADEVPAEIAARVQADASDILLVAGGSPAADEWIHKHSASLGVPVMTGVVPAADLAVGEFERRAGGSLRRFVDLLRFIPGVVRQWWQLEFRSPKLRPRVSEPVQAAETWQCIRLPARLDLQATRDDALLVDQVLADGRHCLLDLSAVQFIDSTGVGLLIRLQKKVRASGKQLILLSPSATVNRALELMRLKNFFASAADLASARELIAAGDAVALTNAGVRALAWPAEVCAPNADAVWKQTEAFILATGRAGGEAVIELGALRQMDRAGAQLMVRARKLARREGRRLRFASPTAAVMEVLHAERVEEFVLGD